MDFCFQFSGNILFFRKVINQQNFSKKIKKIRKNKSILKGTLLHNLSEFKIILINSQSIIKIDFLKDIQMPPKKKKNDIKADKNKAKQSEKEADAQEPKKLAPSKSKSKKDPSPEPAKGRRSSKKDPSPEPAKGRRGRKQPQPQASPPKKKEKTEKKQDKKEKDVKADDKKDDEAQIVKVVTKGGAAVDSLVPDKQTFRVFQQGGKCYAATLNQANMEDNNNKFYIVQVLINEKTGAIHVWNRWGRVGVPGQNCLKGPYPKDAALKQYETKVKDKTVKGNYKQIQIKYNDEDAQEQQPQQKKTKKENKTESRIDTGLQKLINLIFDTKLMDTRMQEIGYDAKKMPLGKLGDSTVKQAYTVLNKITTELKGQNRSKQLSDLSGQFFTLIPHNFGFQKMSNFVIRNEQQVKDKIRMLEAISDMKITTKLLAKEDDSNTAIIDQNYQKLGCTIKTLNQTGQEYKLMKQYFDNTKGGYSKVTVGDIYSINRPTEQTNFNTKLGNNMLLWHGSRITNFVGILSQGLRIAPPEAPASGYLFGKGIYLADLAEKSINYCRSHGSDKALIILIQGALGDPNILLTSNCRAKQLMQQKKKDSTKCWGAKAPPQSCYVNYNGTIIPNGQAKPTGSGSYMGHNEFIVYNMNQARIRYVIEMNMNGN